jgi:hypothetical protein
LVLVCDPSFPERAPQTRGCSSAVAERVFLGGG